MPGATNGYSSDPAIKDAQSYLASSIIYVDLLGIPYQLGGNDASGIDC